MRRAKGRAAGLADWSRRRRSSLAAACMLEGAVGRMFIGVTLCVLAVSAALAQAKQGFICTDTQSTGFKREKGKWRSTLFFEKRFSMVYDQKTVRIKWPGLNDETVYACEPGIARIVQCSSLLYVLVFDENSFRYVHTQMFGHVGTLDDDLVLSYGECQKF
jgi:hypothetical protein